MGEVSSKGETEREPSGSIAIRGRSVFCERVCVCVCVREREREIPQTESSIKRAKAWILVYFKKRFHFSFNRSI